MFGYLNTIEAIKAKARAEYGAEFAPLNENQRIMTWIAGWRSAPTPKAKKMWVHECVQVAVVALFSGLLSAEEHSPVLHEVLFLEAEGDKELSHEERSAWERACAQWAYRFNPGCSCVWCAEPLVGLPTPEVSPEPIPAAPAEKAKAKRGRPAGSKDKEKRVPRNTYVGLPAKQISKNYREKKKAKQRKAEQEKLHQQQRQQQQTPPA